MRPSASREQRLPLNTIEQLVLCRRVNEANGEPIDIARRFRSDEKLIVLFRVGVPPEDRPLKLSISRDNRVAGEPPLWDQEVGPRDRGSIIWMSIDLLDHSEIRGNCIFRISANGQELAAQTFRVD
jgi:hypothetical protein